MTLLIRKSRVLHALMLREMATRYGRSRLGYVWAVLEPVGFIALLSLVFAQIAHAPPVGRSFPLFYATGYVAFHWFHDISSVVGRSVHVNRPLLAFPAVTPLDTVIARFVLQSLTGLAVAIVIFAAILAVTPDQVRPSPVPLLMAFATAAGLGLSVGLFNVWAFALSRTWELAWGLISRPLFLISCVFFSYWSLPLHIRDALWWNPLVHVAGSMRAGFYPGYEATHVSPSYVLAVAAGLALVGLMGLRLAPGRVVAV